MTWLATIAALDLVYLSTLGHATLGDAAVGALVAALVSRWAGGQTAGVRATAGALAQPRRLVWLLPFGAVVLWRAVRASWRAMRTPAGGGTGGEVHVPVGERSATGIAVTAWCTTVSPGSIFLHVDESQQVMVFHYLDAVDPDGIRRDHARFYARHQRRVFP